jgi:DNA helicase II / ATP-dependent DNA helicase PcrA
MAMDREWEQEQKRVDAVVRKIDRQIEALRRQTEGIKENILEISRNFWDDVTLNFSDPHDTLETIASINQQARVMAERERSFRHARRRLTTLVRMKDSPYFGRIDFVEDGESKAEAIYLGIATVRDEGDELPLVYDWRAPIASLYYEGSPGPVRYKTPAGEISGNLKRKRQFIIRDGRIRSMFDTSVTIGDELLQEVLGRHSGTQMKNIVATIQKEQNRIIRSEGKRLLVVSGAAGSGKTSTALQRVAWLLYRYRKSLTAKQVVLFSPNPMFNSYVSTVLPGLGEENMQQTTFQEMLEHRLGKRFRLEDPPGGSLRSNGVRATGVEGTGI